ncbi:chromosome segregation protein Spc25-domain-containing protein [Mycena pura]|uniref:Kinetochore protein SPC25 n=1 Tax=Mycena pura TaxID=153505 RepID=A0AAD7E3W6_9AGAR|nr:chromosome segregation protein Spc25-domain-containing protein [Mycena pura]
MPHVLRVPQIDLSSVLAEQNPHIDLRVNAYDTSARNFLKALSNYKTRTTATIAEKRAQHAAEKKRTIERVANVEAETNQCKIQELQLAADLQREQEERKEAELGVAAFKRQLAALRDKCAAIDSQIEHYRAIAANLDREKTKEKEKLSSMATGTASQLAALESCLSCVVEGVADGQLLVRMSKIDPADPEREFSFVLNVSGDSYGVLTATPSLAALPQLIAQLRDSHDILKFIKDVRQACVDMVMKSV